MLLDELRRRWEQKGKTTDSPAIVSGSTALSLDDIAEAGRHAIKEIPSKAVVALVGDFDSSSVGILLKLIDKRCIIAPLTDTTTHQHERFFDIMGAEWIVTEAGVRERTTASSPHPLISDFRASRDSAGLILFSSGTTGEPKAALHDFGSLLDKFRNYSRPALRTLAFLLFDHWGGLNTLFHTLYNAGSIHIPLSRRPTVVLRQVAHEQINLLPTTPSFLRLALIEGAFEDIDLTHFHLITYGTERMDQATLDRLSATLPTHVDIRQTYGMSELGVFPLKNRSRNELWIRIADPNIAIETRDDVLWIRSPHRMLGYLNAPSPFDEAGWYNTKDLVAVDGDYFRVVGRIDEVINVGGIKVQPAEVEEAALRLPEVCYAKAEGEPDPFLGQHIRFTVQLVEWVSLSKREIRQDGHREQTRREKHHSALKHENNLPKNRQVRVNPRL